jgi:hypothetical protein
MPAKTQEEVLNQYARKYIQENPLARDILLGMAKSPRDSVKISGFYDAINPDEADKYIFFNNSQDEIREQLQQLIELGVIGEISEGFAVPSEYYLLGEIWTSEKAIKRNPKLRRSLTSELERLAR